LKHFASPAFWSHYRLLPAEVQQLADKCFELMKAEPRRGFGLAVMPTTTSSSDE
jgi:hypothetical protein